MKRIIEAIAARRADLVHVTKEEHRFLLKHAIESQEVYQGKLEWYWGPGWVVRTSPPFSKAKS